MCSNHTPNMHLAVVEGRGMCNTSDYKWQVCVSRHGGRQHPEQIKSHRFAQKVTKIPTAWYTIITTYVIISSLSWEKYSQGCSCQLATESQCGTCQTGVAVGVD